jgi:hypothetical protein
MPGRPLGTRMATVIAPLLLAVGTAPAPFTIRDARVVTPDIAYGVIISAAMGPDGSVYVADETTNRIFRISPAGIAIDTIGRAGAGPGEFGMVYRVGVRHSTGEVFAYDIARGELSRFSNSGAFISRHQVPYMFTQVDDVVPLDDGTVAIAGTMSWEGFAKDSAIHVFDTAMVHLRSFGPLPPVKSFVVRRLWGAGNVTPDGSGGLWYARRIPYELYHYSAEGKLLAVIRAPFRQKYGPDDQFIITESGSRRNIATNRGVSIWRPTRVIALTDGSVLAGRVDSTGLIVDRFDRRGALSASGRVADIGWLVGIDWPRRTLWYIGKENDVPVVKQARIGP